MRCTRRTYEVQAFRMRRRSYEVRDKGLAGCDRRRHDLPSPMLHAGNLVARRSEDAIRLIDQQILRTLPAKRAVD